MTLAKTETCTNCGRKISRRQQAYVFKSQIVCKECDGKLRSGVDERQICVSCGRQIGLAEKAYVVDAGLICVECDEKPSSIPSDNATKVPEVERTDDNDESGADESSFQAERGLDAQASEQDPFQFFPNLEKKSPELAGMLSTIVLLVMITVGGPLIRSCMKGELFSSRPRTARTRNHKVTSKYGRRTPPTYQSKRTPKYEKTTLCKPKNTTKEAKATDTLPADGMYSATEGSGGRYKDPIHGFFQVTPPRGFQIEENRNRTTTRLDNGKVVPCSRIRFQSAGARIAVVTRKTLHGTIEQDLNVVLRNYRSAGVKIKGTRFVRIDGVKGAEVLATASGYRLLLVKYKKHGLDHAITASCSPRGFAKHEKDFVRFLRSY